METPEVCQAQIHSWGKNILKFGQSHRPTLTLIANVFLPDMREKFFCMAPNKFSFNLNTEEEKLNTVQNKKYLSIAHMQDVIWNKLKLVKIE